MKNTIIFISAAVATFSLVVLGGFVIYLNFLKKEEPAVTGPGIADELD